MKTTLLALTTLSLVLATSCRGDSTRDQATTEGQPYDGTRYEPLKIHEVMSHSEHKDKVHINGIVTGKVKCETFVFKDQHGKAIHIRVEADEIPDKGLLFNSPAAIHGEVIKVPDKPPYVDVETIHYLF